MDEDEFDLDLAALDRLEAQALATRNQQPTNFGPQHQPQAVWPSHSHQQAPAAALNANQNSTGLPAPLENNQPNYHLQHVGNHFVAPPKPNAQPPFNQNTLGGPAYHQTPYVPNINQPVAPSRWGFSSTSSHHHTSAAAGPPPAQQQQQQQWQNPQKPYNNTWAPPAPQIGGPQQYHQPPVQQTWQQQQPNTSYQQPPPAPYYNQQQQPGYYDHHQRYVVQPQQPYQQQQSFNHQQYPQAIPQNMAPPYPAPLNTTSAFPNNNSWQAPAGMTSMGPPPSRPVPAAAPIQQQQQQQQTVVRNGQKTPAAAALNQPPGNNNSNGQSSLWSFWGSKGSNSSFTAPQPNNQSNKPIGQQQQQWQPKPPSHQQEQRHQQNNNHAVTSSTRTLPSPIGQQTATYQQRQSFLAIQQQQQEEEDLNQPQIVIPGIDESPLVECNTTSGGIKLYASRAQHWVYPEGVSERAYQLSCIETALLTNTLVCLPTGLGKTLIAAVVMHNFSRWFPQGKVVFVAPTRPLVAQQIEACYRFMGLTRASMVEMTGATTKADGRKETWDLPHIRVVFCTPQTLWNDVRKGVCPYDNITCLVLDECHKATGEHDIVKVLKFMRSKKLKFRVLGLSATPGSSAQQVQEVVSNLGVSTIEFRSESDPEVAPYVHGKQVDVHVVEPGREGANLKSMLVRVLLDVLRQLGDSRVYYGTLDAERVSRFALQQAQQEVSKGNGRSTSIINSLFRQASILVDVRDQLDSYGVHSAFKYLAAKLQEAQPLRVLQTTNATFSSFCNALQTAVQNGGACPKMQKLVQVLTENFSNTGEGGRDGAAAPARRAIVFTNLREGVASIVEALKAHEPTITAKAFVGQGGTGRNSGTGMKQKDQKEVLDGFRSGAFNVLVATCIGEEGLDIPEVDLIVCYDATASPTRTVQRQGRTGRFSEGKVVFILAAGKEEDNYRKIEQATKALHTQLRDAHRHFQLNPPGPRMLPRQFNPERLDVEVDHSASQPIGKRKSSRGGGGGGGGRGRGRGRSTAAGRGGGKIAPVSEAQADFDNLLDAGNNNVVVQRNGNYAKVVNARGGKARGAAKNASSLGGRGGNLKNNNKISKLLNPTREPAAADDNDDDDDFLDDAWDNDGVLVPDNDDDDLYNIQGGEDGEAADEKIESVVLPPLLFPDATSNQLVRPVSMKSGKSEITISAPPSLETLFASDSDTLSKKSQPITPERASAPPLPYWIEGGLQLPFGGKKLLFNDGAGSAHGTAASQQHRWAFLAASTAITKQNDVVVPVLEKEDDAVVATHQEQKKKVTRTRKNNNSKPGGTGKRKQPPKPTEVVDLQKHNDANKPKKSRPSLEAMEKDEAPKEEHTVNEPAAAVEEQPLAVEEEVIDLCSLPSPEAPVEKKAAEEEEEEPLAVRLSKLKKGGSTAITSTAAGVKRKGSPGTVDEPELANIMPLEQQQQQQLIASTTIEKKKNFNSDDKNKEENDGGGIKACWQQQPSSNDNMVDNGGWCDDDYQFADDGYGGYAYDDFMHDGGGWNAAFEQQQQQNQPSGVGGPPLSSYGGPNGTAAGQQNHHHTIHNTTGMNHHGVSQSQTPVWHMAANNNRIARRNQRVITSASPASQPAAGNRIISPADSIPLFSNNSPFSNPSNHHQPSRLQNMAGPQPQNGGNQNPTAKKKQKKRRSKFNQFLDTEAQVSGSDSGDLDDDGIDGYEADFINDGEIPSIPESTPSQGGAHPAGRNNGGRGRGGRNAYYPMMLPNEDASPSPGQIMAMIQRRRVANDNNNVNAREGYHYYGNNNDEIEGCTDNSGYMMVSDREQQQRMYDGDSMEEEDDSFINDGEDPSPADSHDDECAICKREDGELLLCDGCPLAFHLGCCGLNAVPVGEWYCAMCKDSRPSLQGP